MKVIKRDNSVVDFDRSKIVAAIQRQASTGAPKNIRLYAPDALYWNGRYYLYFCLSDDTEGVAVSDCPAGPFHDARRLPVSGIDPAVFLDDDGTAYYYWGQFSANVARLTPDRMGIEEGSIVEGVLTEREHHFHEGCSVRKWNSLYYCVFTDISRGRPTCLGYATSTSPLGPFTYRGVIVDNRACDPASWNNHGSIQCFHGQWYVFYHRSSRGTQQNRRLCIEKIEILPDGTIPEVPMTSQGVGDPFGPGETIMGYQACGVQGTCCIDVDDSYGEKLTHISAGDAAIFRYVKNSTSWTGIQLTTRGSGTVKVHLNDIEAGTVQVSGTADLVQPVEAAIQVPAGEYELTLAFEAPEELEILAVTLF